MIISHKYKFVFIHTHRTGGTSIAETLARFLGDSDEVYGYTPEGEKLSEANRQSNFKNESSEQGKAVWKHSHPKYVKQKLGVKKWNEYFKFTVIRNPLDIHYSNYHYLRNTELQKSAHQDVLVKSEKAQSNSFAEFLLQDHTWQYTLCDFATSLNHNNKSKSPFKVDKCISAFNTDLDFIMRYERLKIDFAYFCGLIGLPRLELSWENKSRKLEDRTLAYDEVCRSPKCTTFLEKRHGFDYNYFGYENEFNEFSAKHDSYNW